MSATKQQESRHITMLLRLPHIGDKNRFVFCLKCMFLHCPNLCFVVVLSYFLFRAALLEIEEINTFTCHRIRTGQTMMSTCATVT